MRGANFHSAFYFEESQKAFVGLLRTGALIESLAAHEGAVREHMVTPMSPSTIWLLPINDETTEIQAELLPGIREIGGLALSHLDVDNRSADGFVLYANYKQADVAEETHGVNLYGEPPEAVAEHYSGMIVEALNFGQVIRYGRRQGRHSLPVFRRPYDPLQTSQGHSWLPINIELDSTRQRLFCSFAGFRPRLLSQHIAAAYPNLAVDPARIRYVPPLLMRLDPDTLLPQYEPGRTYLSYAEPVAFTAAGNDWQLPDTAAVRAGPVAYPQSKLIRLKAIRETVPVYRDHIRLVRTVTLSNQEDVAPLLDPAGKLIVVGTLRYQACDKKQCFIPETVAADVTLHIQSLDRTRVPEKLQRKPGA